MQKQPVLGADGEPTGEWKFDSARALKLLGDHVGVAAFKGDNLPAIPEEVNWTVKAVHCSQAQFEEGFGKLVSFHPGSHQTLCDLRKTELLCPANYRYDNFMLLFSSSYKYIVIRS